MRWKPLLVLGLLFTAAGCAGTGTVRPAAQTPAQAIEEIRPGIAKGYLQRDQYPDAIRLLPPPPAPGSAAMAADEQAIQQALTLRGTPRWDVASQDTRLGFPEAANVFSCALGFDVSEDHQPALYRLLRRSLTDAGFSTSAVKKHYRRLRPFVVNEQPVCSPGGARRLTPDAAYPSGHTAAGWTWALILTELAPEKADDILLRGREFGESRVVCNVHWPSDIVAGRMVGSAVVAKLHTNPKFQNDMQTARTEVLSSWEAGLTPTRDCAAEASALSTRQTH